ncbi:MAG: hypothetical protein WDO74_30665 [Pseudomonadota bacterium]
MAIRDCSSSEQTITTIERIFELARNGCFVRNGRPTSLVYGGAASSYSTNGAAILPVACALPSDLG